MAQKFLTSIDLNQNELQNGVVQVLGSDPGSPIQGQIWVRSDLEEIRFRKNGSTTISLVASDDVSSVAQGGTGVSSLTDGGIMLGSGTDPVTVTARPTTGQVLIGSTSGDPVLNTLTGTANRLDIVSASGSITFDVNTAQFPSSASNEHKVLRGGATANTATWGTLAIQGGGTGRATLTDGSVLVGDGTNPVEEIALSNGQLLIGSNGASPAAQTLTGEANRIAITNGAGTITITLDSTQFPQAGAGNANQALISSGANTAAWGTLQVAGGGTGAITLTDHGVLIGSGTGAVTALAEAATGTVLAGNTGADPSFKLPGGDISGAIDNITVNQVGGRSAANIADAVDKRHTQNTDTGTTATSFQVDSGNSGPRIKNEAGVLAIRNSGDSAYADLTTQDLTVEGDMLVKGTQTIVNSNEVSLGDSEITLNEDITDDSQNATGGLLVARMDAEVAITNAANNGSGLIRITAAGHGLSTGDRVFIKDVVGTTEANNTDTIKKWQVTVIDPSTYDLNGSTFTNAYVSGGTSHRRIDARLTWDETSDRWGTNVGSEAQATFHNIARMYAQDIPQPGVATTFDITHNLATRDVVVQVYRTTSPWDRVMTDVEMLSPTQVRLRFASAPANNEYRVVVTG